MLLRLYPAVSPVAAAAAGGVAVLVLLTLRIYNRPDALQVVRVADELGLGGDAVTSFRLLETGAADPWSRAALDRGTVACTRFAREARAGYPVVPRWRSWRDVAVVAAALLVLQFVPDQLGSHWAERRAEQQALRAAAASAQEALDRVRNLQVNGEDVLPEEVKRRLGNLPGEVARAGDRREAAAKLEKARWELDGARMVINPSSDRDIRRLARAWGSIEGEEWQDLAGALRGGGEDDIQKAVHSLTDKLQAGDQEDKINMAAALLAGAGMVEDPALRRALRDTAGAALGSASAAGRSGSGNSPGGGGQNLAAAANSLAGALSGAAATASAGGAMGSASATLAALAQELTGAGSTGEGTLVAGGNSGTGNNDGSSAGGSAGVAPGGSNAGNVHGPCETGSGSTGSGAPGGNGDSGGDGSGRSPGGGQGSAGSGASPFGSGMDMIYTPFRPDGGVDGRVSGHIREGEQGSEVSLEGSPTTLGELRPYTEVYGRYMAEAQQSLGRAPLPPDMEKLVWQYFNTLVPGVES